MGSWPGVEPRRSISMAHPPTEIHRLLQYPSKDVSTTSHFATPNFNHNAAPAFYPNTFVEGPVYEPKRRFSPPLLDPLPNQNNLACSTSKSMAAMQKSPVNHMTCNWNNNNVHKFDRRKISVQGDFYNYSIPFDQRRKEHFQNVESFQRGGQNEHVEWRKPTSCSNQNLGPIRKLSVPLEIKVTPPTCDPVVSQEHMLSPQQPCSSRSSYRPELTPSPMEMETVRKKSSMMEKPVQTNYSSSRKHPNIPSRKASLMATKSKLRVPRFGDNTAYTYTPPPILSPMRNGSGLFWHIAKNITHHNQTVSSACGDAEAMPGLYNGEDVEMSDESPGLKIDEGAGPSDGSPQQTVQQLQSADSAQGSAQDTGHPARKNGFFLPATQTSQSQATFVDELEALRKESYASTSSHRSVEEIYRKYSSGYARKESTMSNVFDLEEDEDLEEPRKSDATPHINIGSRYQARVYKWKEREISMAERDAIEDKDQLVFSKDVLEGIDEEQINAYELLACSQAIPRPGRNKELALHILMENRGNIEASVADLLRSDVIDWEQYSIIYGSNYLDSTAWSPEDVAMFQDAIYKSEKDFQQVSQEVPSKSVRECVEFYYTWKTTCPDDYRKLSNLRRKRHFLVLNLLQMDDTIPMKKCSLEETTAEESESDIETTPSLLPYQGLQDYVEPRPRTGSFQPPSVMIASPMRDYCATNPQSLVAPARPASPAMKDITGLQRNYQPSAPRGQPVAGKKGAQPSADGFFHCRLCDKCFEKVKSLNAHMKSHAMKARAEAEAKAQVEAQKTQQNTQQNVNQFSNTLNINTLSNSLHGLQQTMNISPNLNGQTIGIAQNLLSQPGLGLVQPRPQHPLLQPPHQTQPTPVMHS